MNCKWAELNTNWAHPKDSVTFLLILPPYSRVMTTDWCIKPAGLFFGRFLFSLLFLLVYPLQTLLAQGKLEQLLNRQLAEAKTDSIRIVILGKLADYYYAEKNENKGDSVIEKQIMLAEESRNPNLLIIAFFKNAAYKNILSSTREVAQKRVSYIKQALNFAKRTGLSDYTALAYSNIAGLYTNDGKLDEALNYANLGLATAMNSGNDSVKILCSIELGNVYLAKSDILLAYKNYTSAYDIAIAIDNVYLQSKTLHTISELYKKLNQPDLAKEYILRSLELNKKFNSAYGLMEDYMLLGKLSMNPQVGSDYLNRAFLLADTLHEPYTRLEAQKMLFIFKMLNQDIHQNLVYLDKETGLRTYYENSGPDYINWIKGEIYYYGGKPDSALIYFKRAESSFDKGYDFTIKKNFFSELAEAYKEVNNLTKAITYYKKIIDLSLQSSDLIKVKKYSNELKNLYAQNGDYKQAFFYNRQYDQYSDSLDMQAKEKDLALLEIENENKNRLRQQEIAKEEELRSHNLQYMGITIVVAAAFVIMMLTGMFKVSKLTIRIMGFFSMIFLFEFLILFLDKWIHSITHGKPLWVWGIKIGVISLLFPIHHYVENRIIEYLLSRKLINVRNRMHPRRWLRKKSSPPVYNPEGERKEKSVKI